MSVSVKAGDVIDGSYVIERLLGQGGMGAVFVAREERLGRHVAIKVLLDAVAKIPEAVTRFEREARSAAALQSDHVTRVLSVGHLPSGAPYIVMELLEGEDLAGALERRGPLPVDEVVSTMMHACEALAEAHSLGIVHRDLKPANIFLARRSAGAPRVKLLDFGISKNTASAESKALTATTAIIGTPLYMSPEQLREARNVDGRADLWALGVVMYELLSGAPPFVSDVLADLCVLIMVTNHAPLSTLRPDVPPALDAIVNRCLAKDPAHRFATAHELMVALADVGTSVTRQAPPPARHATPRMNPRPPPSALQMEPTQGLPQQNAPLQGGPTQGPWGPTQALPGMGPPLTGHGLPPPAAYLTRGGTAPRADPHPPATVDPVSNTHMGPSTLVGLPTKGPSKIGLFLVFAFALGVGALGFWQVALKATSGPATTGATSGAPDSNASVAASGGRPSSSSSGAAQATSTAPSSVGAASSAVASGTALHLSPLASSSPPQGPITLGPHLPVGLPPRGQLPPPTTLTVPPPAVAPTMSTPPTALPLPVTKPAPNPGLLMPGARN